MKLQQVLVLLVYVLFMALMLLLACHYAPGLCAAMGAG